MLAYTDTFLCVNKRPSSRK